MAAPVQHQEQQYGAPNGAVPQQQYGAPQQQQFGAPQEQQFVAPQQQQQYAADPHANGAAPHAAAPAKSGPIDNNDIELWKNKFNAALKDPSATINGKSPADSRDWTSGFFGCCAPIDLCCLTYCCPCVTFGKTHHRLNKNANMEGYEPVNTSCLMFLGAGCFGLHWVLEALQRSQVRAKYNLKGSFITDIAAACCCVLCDLTQQEKESRARETELLNGGAHATPQQYKAQEAGMSYEQKA